MSSTLLFRAAMSAAHGFSPLDAVKLKLLLVLLLLEPDDTKLLMVGWVPLPLLDMDDESKTGWLCSARRRLLVTRVNVSSETRSSTALWLLAVVCLFTSWRSV